MNNTKKFKYSLNASIIIIGAIIAVILLNSFLIAFDDKMSLEVDLTEEEFYKLSDETKSVIENIDRETKIVLLYDGSQYEETANQGASGVSSTVTPAFKTKEDDQYLMSIISLVEKYTEENQNIVFEQIDYYTNPTPLWNEYYNAFMKIEEAEMVPYYAMMFIQGDKYEVADYTSYNVQTYNSETKEIETQSNIENVITNKLASFAMESEKFTSILFTQGHGEIINTEIDTVLKKYSYTAGLINLSGADIPEDENPLIVIDSPTIDFTSDEIQKLDSFLKAGGNLHVYFNPLISNAELSNLEAYLADEWGIMRNHGVILDSDKRIEIDEDTEGVEGTYATAEFAEHDIVNSIAQNKLSVMYSSANALDISTDKESSIVVEPVLLTSDGAVLKTVETAAEPVAPGEAKGKHNIMLASTRDYYDINNQKTTGKVVACGSSYAMDTLPLVSVTANEDMLINSYNWMSGGVSIIDVDAKYFPEGGLVIENAHKWIWFSILVVVVPLAVLAAGFVVFIKRRYK